MKQVGKKKNTRGSSAMTVIELSLTLALMLSFASIAVFSVSGMKKWKLARIAGEEVRAVYLAQKSYLADHPVAEVAELSSADILPYMSGGRTEMPSVKSLENEMLSIDFNKMPPVVVSAGATYDPSDSDSDSLWDVGTH